MGTPEYDPWTEINQMQRNVGELLKKTDEKMGENQSFIFQIKPSM
jgi:hypothetical protein